MKSLFLAALGLFFLAGALTGHELVATGDGVVSSTAIISSDLYRGEPGPHEDGRTTSGFHCTVSASCLSGFTLAGPVLANHAGASGDRWRMGPDTAWHPSVLDKDPPVPRV